MSVQQSRCRCQTATTACHPPQARSPDAPGLFGPHAHAAPHPPPLALSICYSPCPHPHMLPIVLYASSHHVNASNAAMYVHRLHPILHHKLHDDHLQCLIADNPLAMTVVAGMGMKDMRMPVHVCLSVHRIWQSLAACLCCMGL